MPEMGRDIDSDLPGGGVRARPNDIDLSEVGVTRLFTVAAQITDDMAKQAEIVALAVVARVDPNTLRRKAGLPVVHDRPPSAERAHITHHQPQKAKAYHG